MLIEVVLRIATGMGLIALGLVAFGILYAIRSGIETLCEAPRRFRATNERIDALVKRLDAMPRPTVKPEAPADASRWEGWVITSLHPNLSSREAPVVLTDRRFVTAECPSIEHRRGLFRGDKVHGEIRDGVYHVTGSQWLSM